MLSFSPVPSESKTVNYTVLLFLVDFWVGKSICGKDLFCKSRKICWLKNHRTN